MSVRTADGKAGTMLMDKHRYDELVSVHEFKWASWLWLKNRKDVDG